MKVFKMGLMIVCCLFLLTFSAQALPLLDFGDGGLSDGVIITPDNGVNIIADDIPLGILKVQLVPGPPTNYNLFHQVGVNLVPGALLDFNTVANTISITGQVPTLGINTDIVLLSGNFTSFQVNYVKESALDLVNAIGPDKKARELLVALGIDPNNPFGFYGFVLTSIYDIEKDIYISVSTDIKNEGKVPEPISLILLGSGLAGAGLYRRFRKPRG